jgi:hypothetical protein
MALGERRYSKLTPMPGIGVKQRMSDKMNQFFS